MWPSQNNLQSVTNWLKTILVAENDREVTNWVRLMIEHVSGMARTKLLMGYLFSESELNRLQAMAMRLNAGEPLQYIIGDAWFMGYQFNVNEHTLIPRPETEELVSEIVHRFPKANSVLDIGTGSGCIAISLALQLPNAKVSALDVSYEALEMARKNAIALNADVDFQHMDILVETPNHTFDIIVSNPPYIPAAERDEMENRVVNFEPNLALFVDDNDPLVFYRRIAKIAHKQLNENGLLAFECHERYAQMVVEMLSADYSNVQLKFDLQEKPRMVFAMR